MVLLLVIVSVAVVFASDFEEEQKMYLFGGVVVHNYEMSDFEDVRISDCYYYQTREGSLLLKLEDANGKGKGIGATFGIRADVSSRFEAIMSLDISFIGEKSSYIGIGGGFLFNVIDSKMKLSVGAKGGVFSLGKTLGDAEVLPGTTPPVILPDGTIREGDLISFDVKGFNVSPILDFIIVMNPKMAVGVSCGYQFGVSAGGTLGAENVSISTKTCPEAFYEPTADDLIRKEIDPKGNDNGFKASVYFLYNVY